MVSVSVTVSVTVTVTLNLKQFVMIVSSILAREQFLFCDVSREMRFRNYWI